MEHKECKGKYYNPNHTVGELELVLETDFPGKKGRDKRHQPDSGEKNLPRAARETHNFSVGIAIELRV